MGKIGDKFKELKKKNREAFIVYLTFGYPSLAYTKKIILSLQESPVDIIELGLPFSDPLADGPILQETSNIALRNGATTDRFFSFLKDVKNKISTPLVVMSYYNPIHKFGEEKFLKDAKEAGIAGILVVDLPIEEAHNFVKRSRTFGLDTIFFITPTTSKVRMRKIANLSRGFIYYISITGITGPKDLILRPMSKHIRSIKRIANLPVCVGFGIHTKDQVRALTKISDGVVVGSVIAKFIKDNYKKKNFLVQLSKFLETLYPDSQKITGHAHE